MIRFFKKIWEKVVDWFAWVFFPSYQFEKEYESFYDVEEDSIDEINSDPSLPPIEYLEGFTKKELDDYADNFWSVKLDKR
ncbi:MAG: hypothetical protein WD512_13555, partial [Candidatus Paceibacterota bacterium]